MKRISLLFVLLVLVALELIMLESFVPFGWRHPISESLNRIFSAQEYKPHPNMNLEIGMMLKQHHLLRVGYYVVTVALAIGNGLLISKVWNAFRRSKHSLTQT